MNDARRIAIGDRQLWAERLGESGQPAVLLLAGAAMQATTWEEHVVEPLQGVGRGVIRFRLA